MYERRTEVIKALELAKILQKDIQRLAEPYALPEEVSDEGVDLPEREYFDLTNAAWKNMTATINALESVVRLL